MAIASLKQRYPGGIERLAGWDKKTALYDPFCGSGTILTEAALMCAGIPPSLKRKYFSFTKYSNFRQEEYDTVKISEEVRAVPLPTLIAGSDISPEMVNKTRRNLREFPFGRYVSTDVKSFDEVRRVAEKGIIITNPPYGERIGENVEEMYAQIGNWLKSEMTGWECWILSSNIEALKNVGLKATRQQTVFNGNLECSFRRYEMYEGSRKS